MKTIKIIDLLNKRANGEEIPKKIKYLDCEWVYDSLYKDFKMISMSGTITTDTLLECMNFKNLNDEVEIIEEDKEIGKIDIMSDEATPNSYYILNKFGTKCYLTKHSKIIADKINELIDKVKKLEKEGK